MEIGLGEKGSSVCEAEGRYCAIISSFDIATKEKCNKFPNLLPLYKFNMEQTVNELLQVNFNDVASLQDLNLATDRLIKVISEACQRNTKFQLLTSKYSKPIMPWISPGILRSLKKQRKLYSKSRKTPWDVGKRLKYKRYRNILTGVIRAARKKYNNNRLQSAQGNSKKTWKILNELRGGMSKRPMVGPVSFKDAIGHAIEDATKMANYAMDYLMDLQDTSQNVPGTLELCKENRNSIFLYPVTHSEIQSIIGSLKSTAAVGVDKIPINIIKALPNLVPILVDLTNRMLVEGTFPRVLRPCIIKLTYKKRVQTKGK